MGLRWDLSEVFIYDASDTTTAVTQLLEIERTAKVVKMVMITLVVVVGRVMY